MELPELLTIYRPAKREKILYFFSSRPLRLCENPEGFNVAIQNKLCEKQLKTKTNNPDYAK